MATHTFEWLVPWSWRPRLTSRKHPATEVYVTGTFDDWSKSVKLDLVDGLFSKAVKLPPSERPIHYKFVVDGNWTIDSTASQERDAADNLNNVLLPSSADGQFSVNPLPATEGPGNPVNLPPGEKVPEIKSHPDSNVTLDRESYDNAGSDSPNLSRPSAFLGGVFGVPPVGRGIIPESSMPMGRPASSAADNLNPYLQSAGSQSSTAALAADVPREPRGKPEVDSFVQSTGSHSSTAVLAADVPKEPQSHRHVPDIVKASIEQANDAPEAADNPVAVGEKAAVEEQLKQEQPLIESMGEPRPTVGAASTNITSQSNHQPSAPRPDVKPGERSAASTAPPGPDHAQAESETTTPAAPTLASGLNASSEGESHNANKRLDKKAKRSSVFFSKIKDKFRH